jgi:hypothetical protein
MKLDASLGLHELRNRWKQRSRIGEHSRALASGLDDAVSATRAAVPRRLQRGRGFSLDVTNHRWRKALDGMDAKSTERRIEQRLYLAYGPVGELGATDLWERLVAFQVPLFDSQKRHGWGHIDLLALNSQGHPVVIELKKHDATETPLRALVEGLANAVAVEENWDDLSTEIRAMCARRGLTCAVAERASPVAVVALAPERYWRRWKRDGELGRSVDAAARDEFRRLRSACAAAGHPTFLASFDWPFEKDPRVRRTDADW